MYAPPASPPQAPKKGWPKWLIVLIALAGVFLVLVPIPAVLAVYGVRKYLVNAKNAEARNALGAIARDVASAYDRDHALCPSASAPVPASLTLVAGMKYQSTASDWQADAAQKRGFACLRFSMDAPQYYQYSYTASPSGTFEATAHGDLNGDGNVSTFTVRGEVNEGRLVIAPSIEETSPQE